MKRVSRLLAIWLLLAGCGSDADEPATSGFRSLRVENQTSMMLNDLRITSYHTDASDGGGVFGPRFGDLGPGAVTEAEDVSVRLASIVDLTFVGADGAESSIDLTGNDEIDAADPDSPVTITITENADGAFMFQVG